MLYMCAGGQAVYYDQLRSQLTRCGPKQLFCTRIQDDILGNGCARTLNLIKLEPYLICSVCISSKMDLYLVIVTALLLDLSRTHTFFTIISFSLSSHSRQSF